MDNEKTEPKMSAKQERKEEKAEGEAPPKKKSRKERVAAFLHGMKQAYEAKSR